MDILEALYYGKLNESERRRTPSKYDEKEAQAQEALWATLTPEQQELFEEHEKWHVLMLGADMVQAYKNGVKTGVYIGMELKDFSPNSYDK